MTPVGDPTDTRGESYAKGTVPKPPQKPNAAGRIALAAILAVFVICIILIIAWSSLG